MLGRASSGGLGGDQFSILRKTSLEDIKQIGDTFASIDKGLSDKSSLNPDKVKSLVAEC